MEEKDNALTNTCWSLSGKFCSHRNKPTCILSVHLRWASMHLVSTYYVPGMVQNTSQAPVSRYHCYLHFRRLRLGGEAVTCSRPYCE